MSAETEAVQDEAAELRHFGYLIGSMIGVLFGLILPFIFGYPFPLWPYAITIILVLMAAVKPLSLQSVRIWWLKLGILLHRITSPILLGLIFFGLVLPIGWVKRSLGKSKIVTKLDRDAASYREPPIESENTRDPF